MFFYVYLTASLAKNKTISYVGYTKDIKNRLKLIIQEKVQNLHEEKMELVYQKTHTKKSNDRRV